jgi:hypothetical protein
MSQTAVAEEIHPFIAVTRVLGCGGGQVAWLLGQELGLPLFDVEKLRGVSSTGALAPLREMVLAIARREPAIFLDGGADLVLPRERGLRVRLLASRPVCVRNIQERFDLGADEAETLYERIEGQRAEFVRRTFCTNPFDPTRHDLALDLERISPAEAVRTIRTLLDARSTR